MGIHISILNMMSMDSLQLPKEHIAVCVADVHDKPGVLAHAQYSLVCVDDHQFGIIVSRHSEAHACLQGSLLTLNILLSPTMCLGENRMYRAEELNLTGVFSTRHKIPALHESLIIIEGEPISSVDVGCWVLYVCEILDIEKRTRQLLGSRLHRLGVPGGQAITY